jgi:O-antigen/teichoic acid export membrane protein
MTRGPSAGRVDVVRGALRDGLWNAGALALPGIANVLVVAILIRSVGPAGFAPWAAAIGILGILIILDGGLSTTIAREVARAVAGDDSARDRVASAVGVYALVGALVLVLGVGLSFLLPGLVDADGGTAGGVVVVGVILGADFAVVVATGGWLGSLRGARRFDLVFVANAAQVSVALPLTVVLVPTAGLAGAAVGQLLGRIVGRTVAAAMVRRAVPWVPLFAVSLRVTPLRRVGAFTLPVLAITVSTHVGVGIDPVIVALGSGSAAVGLYAAGASLVRYLAFLLFPILGVLLPSFSGLTVTSPDAARAALLRCVRLAALVGGLAFGTLAVGAADALQGWIGRSDALSVDVLVLYAIAHAFWTPSQVMILMLIARGQHGLVGAVLLIDAVVNAFVSIVLLVVIGPIGVAISTLLFLALAHLVIIPTVTVRRTGVPATELGAAIIVGFAVAAAIVLAAGLIPIGGAVGLVLRVGVAAAAMLAAIAVDPAMAGRPRQHDSLIPDGGP